MTHDHYSPPPSFARALLLQGLTTRLALALLIQLAIWLVYGLAVGEDAARLQDQLTLATWSLDSGIQRVVQGLGRLLLAATGGGV